MFGELPTLVNNSAIYVSDSVENGVKNMRKNLEYRRENSSFLMKAIPHAKFTDIRWEFNNASGNRFIVKGYGGQTGVRGVKEMVYALNWLSLMTWFQMKMLALRPVLIKLKILCITLLTMQCIQWVVKLSGLVHPSMLVIRCMKLRAWPMGC